VPREDRIADVARRKSTGLRTRDRRSFYLDSDLTDQLDKQYKALEHELYPRELTKSEFLEALFEYSLDHIEDIKARVSDATT